MGGSRTTGSLSFAGVQSTYGSPMFVGFLICFGALAQWGFSTRWRAPDDRGSITHRQFALRPFEGVLLWFSSARCSCMRLVAALARCFNEGFSRRRARSAYRGFWCHEARRVSTYVRTRSPKSGFLLRAARYRKEGFFCPLARNIDQGLLFSSGSLLVDGFPGTYGALRFKGVLCHLARWSSSRFLCSYGPLLRIGVLGS